MAEIMIRPMHDAVEFYIPTAIVSEYYPVGGSAAAEFIQSLIDLNFSDQIQEMFPELCMGISEIELMGDHYRVLVKKLSDEVVRLAQQLSAAAEQESSSIRVNKRAKSKDELVAVTIRFKHLSDLVYFKKFRAGKKKITYALYVDQINGDFVIKIEHYKSVGVIIAAFLSEFYPNSFVTDHYLKIYCNELMSTKNLQDILDYCL
jgi:negative regulator of genetic competence, sporulation and motility